MKKPLSFLMTLSLGILLLFSGAKVNAQTDIIFLSDDSYDDYNIEFLQDQGFNVTKFWAGRGINTWGADTLTMLDDADLVILGRSINSGEFGDSIERVYWNAIDAPVMYVSPWHVRNNRNHLFNSSSAEHYNTTGHIATALIPGDAIFDDVTLDLNDQMLWNPDRTDGIKVTTGDCNGEIVASIGDSIPLIVRFDPDIPFYVGGPDSAVAERVYFGFGIDAYNLVSWQAGYFNLSRGAKQVYLAEVCRMLGIPAQIAVFDKPNHFDMVFLRDITNTKDDYTINFLVNQGFNVTPFWGGDSIHNWGADSIAMLNNADLVIAGRSVNSSMYSGLVDREVWNAISAPLLQESPYATRNNRNHWFNSQWITTPEAGAMAVANIPADGVFDDVTLDGDNSLVWFRASSNAIVDTGNSQGTLVASIGDSIPLIVRFDPDIPFYVDGPDSAVAERVYFGFGIEPDEASHFPLTKDAKQVFLAEISRILGISAPAAIYSAPDYTITFITDDDADDVQQAWLRAQGFALDTIWPGSDITTWSQDTLDILNAAELIIVGRSVGSLESETVPQRNIWDSITAPLIHNSPWSLRSSRANWFNSITTGTTSATQIIEAPLPDDPIFEFATVANDSLEWALAMCDYLVDDSGDGQGTILVGSETIPMLVRFEPDKAFYAGGPDSSIAERVYVAIGSEPAANYFPLTQNAQTVYFAEIMRLLGGNIYAPPVLYGTTKTLAWLETDKGTLDPDFGADVTSYTVVLGVDEGTIEVSATVSGSVTVTGDGVYDLPADNADLTINVVAASQVGQTTTYTILVDIDKSVNVEELEMGADYSIYPNPFSNTITISSSEVITSVAVYNLQGAMVMSSLVNQETIDLDLNTLIPGTYIVKVMSDSFTHTHKIVKQ